MIKNIIFDIDGTLTDCGKPISSKITKQIDNLLKIGTNVCFASARPYRDIIPLLKEDFHYLPIIGCNGGTIHHDKTLQMIQTVSSDLTNKIAEILDEIGVAYIIDGLNSYFVGEYTHPFHDYMSDVLNLVPSSREKVMKEGITKILILSEKMDDIKNIFLEKSISLEGLTFNFHSKESVFDITAFNTNKLLAVLSLSYKLSETAAFGNDKNDVCLLEKVKYAFVVGKELQLSNPHYRISNVSEVDKWINQLLDINSFLNIKKLDHICSID